MTPKRQRQPCRAGAGETALLNQISADHTGNGTSNQRLENLYEQPDGDYVIEHDEANHHLISGNGDQPTALARHGATENEWYLLGVIMGHCDDLLPIVADPKATISAKSTIKQLGKTPSTLNYMGEVIGMMGWPAHVTTPAELELWAKADYGIALNCRWVRGLDVDVADKVLAAKIRDFIAGWLKQQLPERNRANSGKFLLAFLLAGEFGKRAMKVAGGIIEFLANGNQFVVLGRHTSGVHYQWPAGFPPEFPALTEAQFEDLWAALEKQFATEPITDAGIAGKAERLHAAITNDPIAQHLIKQGVVKSFGRIDGRLNITCPFQAEHTDGLAGSDTATVYWPESTGGYKRGHFDCRHAHCAKRTDQEFKDAIGYRDIDPSAEFEALADVIEGEFTDLGLDDCVPKPEKKPLFYRWRQKELRLQPDPEWMIDDVLPHAEFGILFGETTAGKTFAMLDMAMAISRGVPWRGRETKKLRVVYVVAEASKSFKHRVTAYCRQHDINEDDTELDMITDAPNFLDKANVLTLAKTIMATGGADLIILDTWSIVTLGSNENSGEDMGAALKNCKNLTAATKAMVIAVHHCGKDISKGARGWSGLKAAADFEMEVTKSGDFRKMTLTKLKDGQDGQEFGFGLVTHIVKTTLAGKDITSCAVKETLVSERKEQPKGYWQKVTWKVIQEMGREQRSGIEIDAVIEEVKRITAKPDGKDQRRQHVRTAINAMATRNMLQIEGDAISLI